EKGADIHAKDKNGYTALKYASYSKNTELIRLLEYIGVRYG
ncbi:MAG: ankyrin repeat domain-containing protein, partial [Candidatus Micrarchaeota archaeon]|nr:ankyrin repeat domain-containing protein [Candidatus Micrarchaeota archaeon]